MYIGCHHENKKEGRCHRDGEVMVFVDYGRVDYVCKTHRRFYIEAEHVGDKYGRPIPGAYRVKAKQPWPKLRLDVEVTKPKKRRRAKRRKARS